MIAALTSLLLAIAPPEPEPEPASVAEAPASSPAPAPAPDPKSKPDPREVYAAVTRIVAPAVLLEADYRQRADPAEGRSGFAMARARLGLRVRPTDWMLAVATVELIDASGPYLLDGYVRFDATDWLELTVGYSKPPLFASFRHESIGAAPMVVRSAVVNELRVRRDVGVEARFVPKRAPIEAIVRLGNGSTEIRANDNETPTGYAALDLVLGRAWVGGKDSGLGRTLGFRLGAAALVDDMEVHDSFRGVTPLGFVYVQPVTAVGLRTIVTPHAILHAGPVRITAEGAFAQEGREDDDDGDPDTAALALDPVQTGAFTGEVAWTIRGGWRQVGAGPVVQSVLDKPWDGGALELSARADHFWLRRGADDLVPVGGTSTSLALKWWPAPFLALTGYGEATIYEVEPVDTPDRLWSWAAMLRASFIWG